MQDLRPMTELVLWAMPRLRSFAYKLTRDHARMEDLLHDTIVRVLEHADQFRPGTNFLGWAMTIMRNAHISNGRRKANQAMADVTELEIPIAPDQETAIEYRQVMAALARLSPDHREILIVAGACRDNYDLMAQRLGIPSGTAKSRLNRARAALTGAL
jgi:RNA polymerase sigma-70 factor (ECF subfamily)